MSRTNMCGIITYTQLELPLDDWRSIPGDKYEPPEWIHWVDVLTKAGGILKGHFAQDMSGEDQPAFRGWFAACGSYYGGINNVIGWRPCQVCLSFTCQCQDTKLRRSTSMY